MSRKNTRVAKAERRRLRRIRKAAAVVAFNAAERRLRVQRIAVTEGRKAAEAAIKEAQAVIGALAKRVTDPTVEIEGVYPYTLTTYADRAAA